MLEKDDQNLFSYHLRINTFQDFEQWLTVNMAQYYHEFYSVCLENDPEIVGYVYSYDYRQDDLHCKICAYFDPIYRNTGVAGQSLILFIDKLFKSYPLRKVYSPVFGYNRISLDSHTHAKLKLESVLKEYKYYNGKFYDYYMFSISREDFYSQFEFLIGDKDVGELS